MQPFPKQFALAFRPSYPNGVPQASQQNPLTESKNLCHSNILGTPPTSTTYAKNGGARAGLLLNPAAMHQRMWPKQCPAERHQTLSCEGTIARSRQNTREHKNKWHKKHETTAAAIPSKLLLVARPHHAKYHGQNRKEQSSVTCCYPQTPPPQPPSATKLTPEERVMSIAQKLSASDG